MNEYEIQTLWKEVVMDDHVPSYEQCRRWLRFHAPETITRAIRRTGSRMRYRSMDLDHAIRFCSRVCNDETFRLYEQSKHESQAESQNAA